MVTSRRAISAGVYFYYLFGPNSIANTRRPRQRDLRQQRSGNKKKKKIIVVNVIIIIIVFNINDNNYNNNGDNNNRKTYATPPTLARTRFSLVVVLAGPRFKNVLRRRREFRFKREPLSAAGPSGTESFIFHFYLSRRHVHSVCVCVCMFAFPLQPEHSEHMDSEIRKMEETFWISNVVRCCTCWFRRAASLRIGIRTQVILLCKVMVLILSTVS